ncbi:hypothetical protein BpHYR1_016047 [Brachionus plicatilis]|uniref:Uncharacterized protein n=1 Tax=Brachionus plicatilis TaxID=10195 RepID=A0A3M7SSX0_BRAPC|nr:hypothetical protein BpHYR1_016047 [Brachionus plicatilis]
MTLFGYVKFGTLIEQGLEVGRGVVQNALGLVGVQRDFGGARANHAHKLGREVVLFPVVLGQSGVRVLDVELRVGRQGRRTVGDGRALATIRLIDGDQVVVGLDPNNFHDKLLALFDLD